jgi:hypothetical protein
MIRCLIAALFTVFLTVVLPSCAAAPGDGGAPPSLMKPFVDHPGGSRIHYRDAETAHVITLREDGTYQFESMGVYDGTMMSREGDWGWGKLDSHHAELVLDEDKWLLSFVSPDSAMATNEAGGAAAAFQFER